MPATCCRLSIGRRSQAKPSDPGSSHVSEWVHPGVSLTDSQLEGLPVSSDLKDDIMETKKETEKYAVAETQ